MSGCEKRQHIVELVHLATNDPAIGERGLHCNNNKHSSQQNGNTNNDANNDNNHRTYYAHYAYQ